MRIFIFYHLFFFKLFFVSFLRSHFKIPLQFQERKNRNSLLLQIEKMSGISSLSTLFLFVVIFDGNNVTYSYHW